MDRSDGFFTEDDLEEVWERFAADGGGTGDNNTDASPQPAVQPSSGNRRDRPGHRELAVVERDLPDGLFGFTRRDSGHVNVNSNLYKVDKERTIRHEKTHHLHPKDELTIRYINGDLDVRNTLSFQANNASRLGNGNHGFNTSGAAAYGTTGDTQQYGDTYTADAY